MKTLSIRFDIDTPTCLREGVPRLLDLNERLAFRATYFLSVGRAVSRADALGRLLAPRHAATRRAAALSARQKLGLRRYARLALLNPEIGRGSPGIVARLSRSAEVGLHGGRNHDVWHHQAGDWPRARVEAEIDWALAWLSSQGIAVLGFACPGFTEPAELAAVLQERGFLYRADRHGAELRGAIEERPGFFNLATNLLGEPGGVAYLENKRARGLADAEIRQEFRRDLAAAGDQAVMYDHPYYAGIHALGRRADLVEIAREEGYTIVPMSDLARALQRGGGGGGGGAAQAARVREEGS